MTSVVQFVPKSGLTAAQNMAAFIAYCRRLPTFGRDLDWNASAWVVTSHFDVRGMGDREMSLLFTQFSPGPAIRGEPMAAPFSDSAKAYIRYHAALQVRKYPPHRDIQAFRGVYAALLEKGPPNLCDLDSHILDRAVHILRSRLAESSSMQAAERLQAISKFFADRRLAAAAPMDWKHGQRVIPSLFGRVGPEFERRRQSKLPTQEVLDALATAFNVARRPREIIETSVYALLCSAPDRINEVLSLATDCETPTDWEKSQGYGLRWRGSKGYQDHIKWIPSTMVDVVKSAVGRIREHTEQARTVARWYESNPTRVYLPRELEHLRDQKLLLTSDIYDITCVGHTSAWAQRKGLVPVQGKVASRGTKAAMYAFRDVERAIIAMLPKSFPYFDKRTRLKLSEALLVVPYGLFREKHATWTSMIQVLRYDQIAQALTGVKTSSGDSPSIFERLGMVTPEHPLRATTHQFRHWLDTLALKGGLSDWDVAQWSGRKSVRQNRSYDHESSEEILSKLRKAVGDRDRSRGAIATLPKNLPVSREEYAEMEVPNAHSTEIGFCIHDFSSMPCQLFMDCINCREHVCVKGDAFKLMRVEAMRADTRLSLQKAHSALASEWEGAGEWIDVQSKALARLEQLHAILTSPDVLDGAIVQLGSAGRYTIMEQALHDRLGPAAVPVLGHSISKIQPNG